MEIGNSREGGYVAISIILILTAVVLGIIVTVAQLGIGEGQVSLALSKGEDTLHFVEGCMEDAILKLRVNALYAGGSITRPEGTCTITVFKFSNNITYLLTATTTNTSYVRKMQVSLIRDYSITIVSWQEI